MYNIIAQDEESTVVSEYIPDGRRSEAYQSEEELENEFISMLMQLGYQRINVRKEADLIANMRKQLEAVNGYIFTDSEWEWFFSSCIAPKNDGIVEKTRRIQIDYVQNLRRDDGTTKNITIIDKKNIHNNRVQVLNQYEAPGGERNNRYDVTILVNGFPLVHVELKRRGVPIREAFNQIERYQRESFWSESGLFEYVQIFVISNGTNTKYYSNTTRFNHVKNAGVNKSKNKTSNSFEFTSFWADAKNRPIKDLVDFTKTFFCKRTLLNILTRYCVFTAEDLLLVMRPYQICATESVLNRINIANNYKKYGTREAGGYIWHTTGSGKTLTSFKTAQLVSQLDYIDKVLFVVDRKDLDYQTMKEYDRFEKGAANSNRSTAILTRQLGSPDAKIIVTTIQKLSCFVAKNPDHPVRNKPVVIIFDECHRSQFGDMHSAITRFFKKYYLFGFTGTPIFSPFMGTQSKTVFRTTADLFGDRLHQYTIVNAISDQNVLPFKVEYIKTMQEDPDIADEQIYDIDRNSAWLAPERITKVTEYILTHYKQKTMQDGAAYSMRKLNNIEEVAGERRRGDVKEIRDKVSAKGFNSIFAVSSIEAARKYYNEFKRQMADTPELRIKVATIFSFAPNEEEGDGLLGEEDSDATEGLDVTSRDFLERAIQDYNAMFNTNYDTSSNKFPNYYKDVSLRMKNKEIDLLIVVNMFLTGFDAPTLNTLWVDKDLKMHGLMQAFSRTNRILNSVKTYGNIVCFRNLKNKKDQALSLFGDKEAGGITLLRSFDDYYRGYTDDNGKFHVGYKEHVEQLLHDFPLPISGILGEQEQRRFINLYSVILRIYNILVSFDEFNGKEILSDRQFQDYAGAYRDYHDSLRRSISGKAVNVNDDIVFEMELLDQYEVGIDYVLDQVFRFAGMQEPNEEILLPLMRQMNSSPLLRSKKGLIETFLQNIRTEDDVGIALKSFVAQERAKDIMAVIDEERLDPIKTREFMAGCFRDGFFSTRGTEIDDLLPPISRFGGTTREMKRQTVIEKLKQIFDKYDGFLTATVEYEVQED